MPSEFFRIVLGLEVWVIACPQLHVGRTCQIAALIADRRCSLFRRCANYGAQEPGLACFDIPSHPS